MKYQVKICKNDEREINNLLNTFMDLYGTRFELVDIKLIYDHGYAFNTMIIYKQLTLDHVLT